MSWATWNKRVATGLVASAICVVGFNVAIDPYSVLKTAEWMRQGYNVNERFRKVEFLRNNIGKFDSFIVGSSTMGLFNVEDAEAMRPGSQWYNLAFLSGTPPEALRALKLLKEHGEPIKEVMMGVDIFAFRQLDSLPESWRREHPLISGESWYQWYKSHLFASSVSFGVEKVLHNLKDSPRLFYDVDGTGRYYLKRWDRLIAQDESAFIKENIYGKAGKRRALKA